MRTSESAKPENSRNFYRDFKESAYNHDAHSRFSFLVHSRV
jgi:hypothetical protein